MRNSNLSSESDYHARKARKNVENDRKGSGKSEKNARKWNFSEKPPMKDFKNGGFYIPKIYKTDSWKKKLEVTAMFIISKFKLGVTYGGNW